MRVTCANEDSIFEKVKIYIFFSLYGTLKDYMVI